MSDQPQPKIAEPIIDELANIKAKLTPEEKENFFKSFLSDKPYITSETLFSGQVEVKFTTLNIKQNNSIMLQMQYDRDFEVAKNTDAYVIKVIQYRLAASILELDKKSFGADITELRFPNNPKEGTTYLLKKLELMEEWPVHKISSLTDAFNRFERKVRALTEESFKENF